jgi:DNA-binding NtrC family response regulator
MAPRVLFCWIGNTDLAASRGETSAGDGPIGQALVARKFDQVVLLCDHAKTEAERYSSWLKRKADVGVSLVLQKLSSPTDFGEIYEAATGVLRDAFDKSRDLAAVYHLSPGTPAMAAVWIILAKTRFPAELIESSRERGVRTASVPFEFSADFIPDLLQRPDESLKRLTAGLPPEAPEFDQILHRSDVMKRLVARARRVAPRSVPVLIEGESGTGKELLARAIHMASPRRSAEFKAINCGAIPKDLVESELFGHAKGAFTGALAARAGYFEAASGGTLFLDEVGELPPHVQVKLLRVLQEKEIVRLGETKSVAVDVRIVAATNRSLVEEVAEGRFREDLFFRLAVAVLKVPPLRDRAGDLPLLTDRLLEDINQEFGKTEPGYEHKTISSAARNLILRYTWPGNVRELGNTLRRAVVWSSGTTIGVDDMRESLLDVPRRGKGVLDRPLGEGFSIQGVIDEVAKHYLSRALDEAHGNLTKAAALVGLPSYQTLNNWRRRHRLD